MIGNRRQRERMKQKKQERFIVDGEIDHTAIRKEAEVTANRVWDGSHMIYGSKAEMVDGFVAGILKDLK